MCVCVCVCVCVCGWVSGCVWVGVRAVCECMPACACEGGACVYVRFYMMTQKVINLGT